LHIIEIILTNVFYQFIVKETCVIYQNMEKDNNLDNSF